jgi:hypothetical protein
MKTLIEGKYTKGKKPVKIHYGKTFKARVRLRPAPPMEPTMPPDEIEVRYENHGVDRYLDNAIIRALKDKGWAFTGSGFAFMKNGTREMSFKFNPWREDQIEGRTYARYRGQIYKIGNRRNDLVELIDTQSGVLTSARIRSLKFDFWVKTITFKTTRAKAKK